MKPGRGVNANARLDYKRKIVKSWREISDVKRNRFEYVKVIDYGVVKSTNEKQSIRRRQEQLNEKKKKMTVLADNRQEIKKLSEMKRNNFFKTMNMKRKRDEDRQEIEDSVQEQREKKRITKYGVDQPTENITMEDNLAREPRPLNEKASKQIYEKKIQEGASNLNLKKLTNFFENKNTNVRGQRFCLAMPANRTRGNRKSTSQPSPEVALAAKNVIGGDFGNGSDPANGGSQ